MACNLTDAIADVQVLTRFHVDVEEERYLPCFESTNMTMSRCIPQYFLQRYCQHKAAHVTADRHVRN
jgi:hypothetical protein